MPTVQLLNSTSLKEWQELMHSLIDEYYELKNSTRAYKKLVIKSDLDRLVTAMGSVGIEVEWVVGEIND